MVIAEHNALSYSRLAGKWRHRKGKQSADTLSRYWRSGCGCHCTGNQLEALVSILGATCFKRLAVSVV